MNNIWLHRISHHAEVSHPLLKQNQLTIGFSDFSTSTFVEEVLTKGWNVIDNACDTHWGVRPRVRHSLWRFLHEMKTGDLVVVPGWGDFSVYKLVGDRAQAVAELNVADVADWHGKALGIGPDGLVKQQGDVAVDLGFFWRVEPIQQGISRDKYADAALTARMKIRTTNADIGDLRSNIEQALRAAEHNQPLNLHAQITEQTVPSVLALLQSTLNPGKLERLIKWYFKRVGASDVYMPASNARDKGPEESDADVIATFEPIKTIIYVQAKLHSGETSSWASKQVATYRDSRGATVDEYSKLCWVVSTADNYSAESIAYSKENDVRLLNGKQFVEMILEAGLDGLDQALNK